MAVKNSIPLTAEQLRDRFDYNKETGVFTWRNNPVKRGYRKEGTPTGTLNAMGYIVIGINYKLHHAHRLAWLYVHGEWPKNNIDHIDGNPSNNRLDNLREATQGQNMQNQSKPQSRNKSGCLGVHWCIRDHKWIAKIGFDGRQKFIGRFDTPELAHQAYLAVKSQVHPFAPNISL